LAEVSKYNPLKVLHSRLENTDLAFIGISNWTLDASKQNRGITLNKIELEKEDLLATAKNIK
jgi:hypothetical protein